MGLGFLLPIPIVPILTAYLGLALVLIIAGIVAGLIVVGLILIRLLRLPL